MKKLLCVLSLVIVSIAGFSQTSDKVCYAMKDGKMMVMKHGKMMMMSKDMKLSNGEMVMKDGTVKMTDGTTSMLKEGQYVDMKGKMGMVSDMKMDKMKMDSTKMQ